MKIFLDFDDFFFDTENAYGSAYFALLGELTGATDRVVSETARIFTGASFAQGIRYSTERHLQELANHVQFDRGEVFRGVERFHVDLTRFVFAGSDGFLSQLDRDDVYLLTFGDEFFQRMKVAGSGLEPRFREIIVAAGNKLEEIDQVRLRDGFRVGETIVFGDNRCEYFSGAKERGITGIHLKRASDRFSRAECVACEYQVGDFNKLEEQIGRLHQQERVNQRGGA